MYDIITPERYEDRAHAAILTAWYILARRIAEGSVSINLEATLQNEFPWLLRETLPLASRSRGEHAEVKLEVNAPVDGRVKRIDVMATLHNGAEVTKVAIEMKAFLRISQSGNNRGANNLYRRGMFEDLESLADYKRLGIADQGIFLAMTDFSRIGYPKTNRGKLWAQYDTSHGNVIEAGGASYRFDWDQIGDFWFAAMEAQG